MKVQAIKTFQNLKDIFQKGDILTLNIIRHSKDTEIQKALYGFKHPQFGIVIIPSNKINPNQLKEGMWKFSDPVIAPKGSYNGYTITTKKGLTYPESSIVNMIGYVPLNEIFKVVTKPSLKA